LLRSIAVRLARATGGGVGYWMELPIPEMLSFMEELNDQIRAENDAVARRK